MEILVSRGPSARGATIGQLSIGGVHECYTLEDEVREVPGEPVEKWKVKGETAIPEGRYRVLITRSNRFSEAAGHDVLTPELQNVPGFSGIRIHKGNWAKDTEGCILVGVMPAPDGTAVWSSKTAYERLFPKIDRAIESGEEVWITIRSDT